MYMNRMLEIGKLENGYVVEARVPFKKKEKEKGDKICHEYPGSAEKKYIAASIKEVNVLIAKLMPMLDEEFTSESEFDKAFEKAAGGE